MMRIASRLLGPMLVIGLVACAAPGETPVPTPPSPPADHTRPPVEDVTPVPPENDARVGEVPDELLTEILRDAEARTDVSPDEIEVVRAEAVTWSDGSLGCPQEGMMYTQALVDGYHVELRADAEDLDYRADGRGSFILCENALDLGGNE
jgi:hypothetical protein